jgi:hypothetical protein
MTIEERLLKLEQNNKFFAETLISINKSIIVTDIVLIIIIFVIAAHLFF